MNYVGITEEPKTLISLCTGMRGLERGLERNGINIRVLCYVEREGFIIENLVQQMEQGVLDEAPIWSCLKTFNGRPFRGMVDIITAGFPCQPFSVAGKQLAKEDPRHLWPYIGKGETSIVGTVRPVCCFFENVPGLLTLGYREVRSDLEGLGYTVEEGIFSAAEVGAPHQRKRLFILAIRTDQLGNPTGNNEWRERSNECSREIQAGRSSDELANTEHYGYAASEIRTGVEERSGVSSGQEDGEQLERRGNNMADTSCSRGTFGISESEQWEEGNSGVVDHSSNKHQWPARPGQEQFEWEAPRIVSKIKSGFCASINGDEDEIDFLCVKEIYETYTSEKKRAIEEMCYLWERINSEEISTGQSIGGLFSIFEKEILWSEVLAKSATQRLQIIANAKEDFPEIQEIRMRTLSIKGETSGASYRQECIKFIHRELTNAMCILSCQIALANGQESSNVENNKAMQYLWDNYKDTCWNVSKTLSEVQKIWRPIPDEKTRREQLMDAYKSYRLELFETYYGYNFREDLLRMAGNGVVEQTAELAFRTLLAKHGLA